MSTVAGRRCGSSRDTRALSSGWHGRARCWRASRTTGEPCCGGWFHQALARRPGPPTPVAAAQGEHSWFAHSVRIWDCCWASDGGEEGLQLATAGEDGSAKLWRIACGRSTKGGGGERIELLSTLRGHAGKHVWCVAATSGGAGSPRLLASGGADGAVKLWPLSSAASDGGDRDEHRLCQASLELSSIEVSGGEGLPRDAPIRAVQV